MPDSNFAIHRGCGATGVGKAEPAETFQFEGTRAMFDLIDSLWEAPTDNKTQDLSGKRVTN